ncbi:MAG: lytic transglycosylase domain-containing protein [Alphaproteobacteria bacterium]
MPGDDGNGFRIAAAAARAFGLVGLIAFTALSLSGAGASAAEPVNTAALDPEIQASGKEAPLPELLTAEDAARYTKIFALQEAGEWPAADHEIEKLTDRLLMGHVLAQRYLHPTLYRSGFGELAAWLELYADHPEASRIYRLALKRMPQGAETPEKPVGGLAWRGGGMTTEAAPPARYEPSRRRTAEEHQRAISINATVQDYLGKGWPTGAKRLLEREDVARLFDPVELDELLVEVAAVYSYFGKPEEALALAGASARRSGVYVPMAHWVAGLAAWHLGRWDEARPHFQAVAEAAGVPEWMRAAGGYWAARAHLAGQRPELANHWLAIAAGEPRTFYGLLARHALGLETHYDWKVRPLTDEDIDLLLGLPGGVRALALLQVGERQRAELELRRLAPGDGPELARALLALANRASLPALSMALGGTLASIDSRRHDGALYPVPDWRPPEGYIVDHALVFAIMRQESHFKTRAKSRSGARGLMQLMPGTASFIARDGSLKGAGRYRLFDPELNISLGQKYLSYLLGHKTVQGDLLLLVAAYNGGPGNLAKWQRHIPSEADPLLFIETIPSRETRRFIKCVLSNLWIYRERLGQPAPSLAALAAGEWPPYTSLDSAAVTVAKNDGN